MKHILALIIAMVLVMVLFSCFPQSTIVQQSKPNPIAENALVYLMKEVQEIKWLDIDGNNAYIGFTPIPKDWSMIIRGAAVAANKATNFGFHVWAIDAIKYNKGWRPGSGTYLGTVTARNGKIE